MDNQVTTLYLNQHDNQYYLSTKDSYGPTYFREGSKVLWTGGPTWFKSEAEALRAVYNSPGTFIVKPGRL